jgi:phosphoglucosamine mutase
MLQAAFSSGLASGGADVIDLGVLPTPAIAHLSAERNAPAAVVSASHNPFTDNGVKLFEPGGRKLADDVEARIEDELAVSHEAPVNVGTLSTDTSLVESYERHLAAALDGRRLDGLRVVVDCANGAASAIAGSVFRRAGADVVVLHAQPDGTNINHGCGSTHPESLQAAVVDARAHLGLALDGDADRVLAVGPDGSLVDGDVILALCAVDFHERGLLHNDALVVTVMSNLGLRIAMAEHDIHLVETAVGDRYVLEALEEGGHSLGGEQSGHIIFRDLATTGDGLLTGLLLCDLVVRRGLPLDQLAATAMTRLPQVLLNVRVKDRDVLTKATTVHDEVAAVETELGDRGRVVLRASGTEPLVRVMVEAPTDEQARAAAERIAAAVERASAP